MQKLERYIVSTIRDTGTRTRVRMFNELLTRTEKIMLAKRIAVLLLLKKGMSPYKISTMLHISPSTAERFQRAVNAKKYTYTTDWIWRKHSKEGSRDALIETLLSLAFTGRTQSFKKFVAEL